MASVHRALHFLAVPVDLRLSQTHDLRAVLSLSSEKQLVVVVTEEKGVDRHCNELLREVRGERTRLHIVSVTIRLDLLVPCEEQDGMQVHMPLSPWSFGFADRVVLRLRAALAWIPVL